MAGVTLPEMAAYVASETDSATDMKTAEVGAEIFAEVRRLLPRHSIWGFPCASLDFNQIGFVNCFFLVMSLAIRRFPDHVFFFFDRLSLFLRLMRRLYLVNSAIASRC